MPIRILGAMRMCTYTRNLHQPLFGWIEQPGLDSHVCIKSRSVRIKTYVLLAHSPQLDVQTEWRCVLLVGGLWHVGAAAERTMYVESDTQMEIVITYLATVS